MSEKAPKHLDKAGRDFWKRLHDEYDFTDSAESTLVVAASECLDRMEAAKKAIKEHGEIVTDRYGQVKINPACELERRAKQQFLAVLKQLGLENEPVDHRYQHSRGKRRGAQKKTA